MTDAAMSYRHGHCWKRVLADRGAGQISIKPHCPCTNSKVERFNRTVWTKWAYRQPFLSNNARRDALVEWLDFYSDRRPPPGHQRPDPRRPTANDLTGQYINVVVMDGFAGFRTAITEQLLTRSRSCTRSTSGARRGRPLSLPTARPLPHPRRPGPLRECA